MQVLADTGFSSVEFLEGVKKLRLDAIVGIPKNRTLEDGGAIRDIMKKGQLVRLSGFKDTVTASWFYLHRDGKLEKRMQCGRVPRPCNCTKQRFVISTRPLKGTTITW